jgi:hypothetical protein
VLQDNAKALLGDFETPGGDWFEDIDRACEKKHFAKATLIVRAKRSTDDVCFTFCCYCESSSQQDPVRLNILAVRPDDTDVVIIDAPPMPAPVAEANKEPAIVPAKLEPGEDAPLWGIPLESAIQAEVIIKPETASESAPKREPAPTLNMSTPVQPIPGPSPKKRQASK